MPKIRTVAIQNFRSIRRLEMNATDLTTIVGDNDCGKSNILRALNLFFNGETNPGESFNFSEDYNRFSVPPARKAKEITIELTLELPENYHNTNGQFIRWKKVWRQDGIQDSLQYHGVRESMGLRGRTRREVIEIPARSNVHALLRRIEYEYVPAIRSAEFFRKLRGRIYGVIAEVAEGGFRQTSAEFETAISLNVEGLLTDILDELSDDAQLKLPNDLSGIFERLDFLNPEGSISLDQRGDGIKARYIPLILKFIAEKKRQMQGRGAVPHTFIWAYEEPENNLEFRRAQELADTFLRFAGDELIQIILTTHSPIFYNLQDEENDLCTAYHVVHGGSETGTNVIRAEQLDLSLDQCMGAMSIIAPHVRSAQNALSTALEQSENFRQQLEATNAENRPAIFVEGPCEFILYSAIFNRLRRDAQDVIFLAEPPARAGANYVSNMLRSWEYRTKHLINRDRQKAFGILDRDAEGNGATTRFKEDIRSPRFTRAKQLDWPTHLIAARDLGIVLPITCEELLPPDEWILAEGMGFLMGRDKKGLISNMLTERLVEEEVLLSTLIDPTWAIYFNRRTNSDFKSTWASRIVELSDDVFERAVGEHLSILDSAIEFLVN